MVLLNEGFCYTVHTYTLQIYLKPLWSLVSLIVGLVLYLPVRELLSQLEQLAGSGPELVVVVNCIVSVITTLQLRFSY